MKKNQNYLLILAIFAIFTAIAPLKAQHIATGKLVDTKGQPIGDAEVILNGRIDFIVNRQGTFSFMYPQADIQTVTINKRGYRVKNWEKNSDKTILTINVYSTIINSIKGRLIDIKGINIPNAKIILDGLNSVNTATSDARGVFNFKLNTDIDQAQVGFIINGTLVRSEECLWDGNNVTVRLSKVADKGDLMAQKDSPNPNKDTKNEENQNPQKIKQDQNIDKQNISVLVYNENKKPKADVHVSVNGVMHITDKSGLFMLTGASESKNFNFVAEEQEIDYIKHSDNNVFIYLKKTYEPQIRKEVDEIIKDTASIDYQQYDYEEDFNRVVNQLELKKQLLIEKSEHIREEMDLIGAKLRKSTALSPEQKLELKTYLGTLEGALVKNEVAYEEAEGKMQIMVDKMKHSIYEKDSAVSEMQHEVEDANKENAFLKVELIIAVFLGLGMLILAILMYRQSKRMAEQKAEIEKQKVEIEHAYSNIKIISDIGQDITATLDFKELIQTVNDNLSILMDASFFGVGVVNHEEGRIDFTDFIKNGQIQQNHSELLTDNTKFSAWCVKHRKVVFVTDLEKEYKKYLHTNEFVWTAEMPKSLIYMPLIIEDKVIGVITVQSDNRNAYKEIDVKILQTLDSYIAIALSNINAYQIINNKNHHITDSIRYAQTIQQAILPNNKQMSEAFDEHFIIYKPKDIVSGDFYWLDLIPVEDLIASEKAGGAMTFLAVVDCTGHGVPGAFMSMVANHLLSEIINVKHIYSPSVVLETLDARVRESLKQYEKVNDDGMDISLCQIRYDENTVKILYAGARRPLFYYQKSTQTIEVLRGDRMSIGGLKRKENMFVNKELSLRKGDYMYMYTDGLTDQNSTDMQKFSSKRLKEFFQNTGHLSVIQQGEFLQKAFADFMQNEEQRDDIAVIGVKL
jgi:serine phosphatase RsbU (regulator of sigma subunit)